MKYFLVYGGDLTDRYYQPDLTVDFAFHCTLDDIPEKVHEAEQWGEGDNWIKIIGLELPEL